MLGVTEVGLTPRRRLRALLAARSRLERLAALHTGPRLFKFAHYYPAYHAHISRFRRRPVTLLEIGVGYGGSLRLWRRYFGRRARIIGIDMNPDAAEHAGGRIHVEIGSQADPEFLARVARDHGPFDIVIDDGSHAYAHQLITFQALFPHIAEGGIYACEDLQTSYQAAEFGGGVNVSGTYVEFLKTLIDALNGWFWREGFEDETGIDRALHALHFHPALVIIEKRRGAPPVLTHVGDLPEPGAAK